MCGHWLCIYLAECNLFYSVFCYLTNKSRDTVVTRLYL